MAYGTMAAYFLGKTLRKGASKVRHLRVFFWPLGGVRVLGHKPIPRADSKFLAEGVLLMPLSRALRPASDLRFPAPAFLRHALQPSGRRLVV